MPTDRPIGTLADLLGVAHDALSQATQLPELAEFVVSNERTIAGVYTWVALTSVEEAMQALGLEPVDINDDDEPIPYVPGAPGLTVYTDDDGVIDLAVYQRDGALNLVDLEDDQEVPY